MTPPVGEPLTAETARLLLPGDVLRFDDGNTHVFRKTSTFKGGANVLVCEGRAHDHDRFTFVSRPERRAPDGMVQVRMRDGFECIAHTGTRWTHYDRPTAADIIAYRPVQSDAPAEQGGEREAKAWRILETIPAINDLGSQYQEDIQDAILAALQAAPAEASLESLKRSRDVANYRAHQLVRALLEVKDSIKTYPLDDTATCMCGSPVEGHNVGSGHAPVSQADHAISLIVGDINKALGLANTPDDALGTGRPDDYEGPDAGMHDTEVVDDDSDDLHEIEDAAK